MINRNGRPQIPIDLESVRAMLAKSPLVVVANELGIHRNTLYRRMSNCPKWREALLQRSHNGSLRSFIAEIGTKTCRKCQTPKPLSSFPIRRRQHSVSYRACCKPCTQQRWKELCTIRDRERRTQKVSQVIAICRLWAEFYYFKWRYVYLHSVNPDVLHRRPYSGRPRTVRVDKKRVIAALANPCPSVRVLARRIGIHFNTLFYRLQVDASLNDLVQQTMIRPHISPQLYSDCALYYPDVDVWTLTPNQLYSIVDKAIPYRIPLVYRADLCHELITGLLGKEIELKNLLREMRHHISQFKRRYNTAFFSLDATVRATNNLTIGQTIAAEYR